MTEAIIKQYKVWDLPTRLFHWVNFTTVLLLILVGLLMLYKKDLGITSLEAKIAIKEIHILIGYLFAVNLFIRLVWGFIGNRFARWSNIIPGKGFGSQLAAYIASIKSGEPQQFLGHNPMGRLAVVLLMLLLVSQAATGLVRAGTDVYYPPFGSMFAAQVAAEGVDPASLKPYDKTGVDPVKYKALSSFKEPFGEIHIYTAYALMLLILLHIAAVVRAEISENEGLVSAIFSGRKNLSKKPEDLND
ncbi:MAG: cytochrome b/b6 domain-containing protein [Mariprofundus sp.]